MSIAPAEILSLDRLKSIEVTDSIDSVLGPLQHKHITYFDHNILQYIIKQHGSEEDKEELKKFLKEFKEYCNRSVFEVPQAIFGEVSSDSKTFIIKIDERHFSDQFSLHDLKAVECKLANVLSVDICSLNIRTVARGCIKVIVSIPISIAGEALSQLDSSHNTDYLEAKGIHIMPGSPGKPEASWISATSIVLHWSKPEYGTKDIQRYTVSYKIVNDSMVNTWESVETNDDALSFNFEVDQYTLISDKEDISLVFKVNAVNEYGEGMESAESDIVELPCELTTQDTISPFRIMLTHICELFTPDNASSLAYINGLPTPTGNALHKPLNILIELEKRGVFSHENIEPLISLLTDLHRVDIINTCKIREYKERADQISKSLNNM